MPKAKDSTRRMRGKGAQSVAMQKSAYRELNAPAPKLYAADFNQGHVWEPSATPTSGGGIGRDLGISCKEGGSNRVLWVFGDTFLVGVTGSYTPTPADTNLPNLRYSTHAHGIVGAAPGSMTTLTDERDATVPPPAGPSNAPLEFVISQPLLASFPDGDRHPLWGDSLLPHPSGSGWIMYYYRVRHRNTPELELLMEASFVADIPSSGHNLTRAGNEVQLWTGPGGFLSGSLLAPDGYIYLYTTDGGIVPTWHEKIARVPHAQYKTPSSYRYWDGVGWTNTDPKKAADISLGGVGFDGMGGFGGIGVTWNEYLGKFVMTHAYAKQPADTMCVRVADAPEGPWSRPAKFKVPSNTAATYGAYTFRQHPWAQEELGRVIWCTYYRGLGGFSGELRIVRIALGADPAPTVDPPPPTTAPVTLSWVQPSASGQSFDTPLILAVGTNDPSRIASVSFYRATNVLIGTTNVFTIYGYTTSLAALGTHSIFAQATLTPAAGGGVVNSPTISATVTSPATNLPPTNVMTTSYAGGWGKKFSDDMDALKATNPTPGTPAAVYKPAKGIYDLDLRNHPQNPSYKTAITVPNGITFDAGQCELRLKPGQQRVTATVGGVPNLTTGQFSDIITNRGLAFTPAQDITILVGCLNGQAAQQGNVGQSSEASNEAWMDGITLMGALNCYVGGAPDSPWIRTQTVVEGDGSTFLLETRGQVKNVRGWDGGGGRTETFSVTFDQPRGGNVCEYLETFNDDGTTHSCTGTSANTWHSSVSLTAGLGILVTFRNIWGHHHRSHGATSWRTPAVRREDSLFENNIGAGLRYEEGWNHQLNRVVTRNNANGSGGSNGMNLKGITTGGPVQPAGTTMLVATRFTSLDNDGHVIQINSIDGLIVSGWYRKPSAKSKISQPDNLPSPPAPANSINLNYAGLVVAP